MNTPIRAHMYELVLDYLKDEHAKLHSLAMCLTKELEPADDESDHPQEHAWRLAQMMEERLETTTFSDSIRAILFDGSAPPAPAQSGGDLANGSAAQSMMPPSFQRGDEGSQAKGGGHG